VVEEGIEEVSETDTPVGELAGARSDEKGTAKGREDVEGETSIMSSRRVSG
jgi:hypothetical protein